MHELRNPEDPRKQLPWGIERPDLIGIAPRLVFEKLCQEWHISHTGTFIEPEALCP